jgi:hypothetical protein
MFPNTFSKKKNGIYTINLRDKLSNGADMVIPVLVDEVINTRCKREPFEYNTKNIDKVEYIIKKFPHVFIGSKILMVLSLILLNGITTQRSTTTVHFNKYYYKQNYSDISKLKEFRIIDINYLESKY